MNTLDAETKTDSGHSFLTDGLAVVWRCFHCDEAFVDPAEAALHFGTRIHDEPACRVDAAQLRELERQLDRYRDEDTDLHREIHRLHSARNAALMRSEELGYSRGLADGMKMTANAQTEAPPEAVGSNAGATMPCARVFDE